MLAVILEDNVFIEKTKLPQQSTAGLNSCVSTEDIEKGHLCVIFKSITGAKIFKTD